MLRKLHTAKSAARGRTSIFAHHHRYHSRLTRFEPLESRQLLTATVIQVTTTVDTVDSNDGFISLREAILEANASPADHEIQLAAGTYTLTRQGANEDAALTGDLDIANSGSLKIVGASGATTTIDASGLFDAGLGYGDRIFDVQANAVVEIEGLTLTGGSTPMSVTSANQSGGAIRSLGGQVSVSDSNLSTNKAAVGGGIFADGGQFSLVESTLSDNSSQYGGGMTVQATAQLTIADSTFSGNTALQSGGALYRISNSKELVISGSTFSHNIAENDGGAISSWLSSAKMTIEGTSISDNQAPAFGGGGIYHDNGGSSRYGAEMVISNCIVSNNSSAGGGGIYNRSVMTISDCAISSNSAGGGGGILNQGVLTVTDSVISQNTATNGSGGGIYDIPRPHSSLRITNSTMSENSATEGGGGIRSEGVVIVEGSTIVFNSVASAGGGISVEAGGTATLTNSIVAGNIRGVGSAETPSDIQLSRNATIAAVSSFNLIGDPNSAGGLVHGTNGNIVGDASGNLLDVSTVLDTTLADNGGPTLTHALVPGSPAFNAGDPLFDPNATNPPTTFDQRGDGFARVKGGRLDIGAFEGIPDPQPANGVIVVGTFADVLDSEDGVWSLREAVIYANSHPEDNEIQLPAGTYTLTRQGANEDATLTGDLDIANSGSLKIVGASSATTTIDAAGLFNAGLGYGDRVFDVLVGASFEVRGLTLTGGNLGLASGPTPNGGGLRILGGQVSIVASAITSNTRGGIYNTGQLTINDSSVLNNTARGLWNLGSATVIATDLSGNSGVGIYNAGIAAITDSSINDNSDTGIFNVGGNVTISGSQVSRNSASESPGIYNASRANPAGELQVGEMTILNSTIAENVATATSGASAGGIYNGARMRIEGSSIVGNEGISGGGIQNSPTNPEIPGSSELVIIDTTISGNSASNIGGGIWGSGNWTIIHSIVSGNSASNGGGAYLNSGTATITGSTFADNSARFNGGGAFSQYGLFSVTESTFSGNTARTGGGFYLTGHTNEPDNSRDVLIFHRSMLSGNAAVADGGAIYQSSGRVELADSTLSRNVSNRDGGAIASDDAPYWLEISRSTITGNRADADGNGVGSGGGLQVNTGSHVALDNTIIAGNLRGNLLNADPSDVELTGGQIDAASSFNLIGDPNSAGGLTNGANGNILGDGSGNLLNISTLLDTTLADNGGPTMTHALVPGSPAFNAGDPLFDPNATSPPTPFDQRGDGFARVKGGRLDIGAFEGIPDPQPANGVIVVGTFADVLDSEDGVWSLREAVIYANSHPEDNEIQLAAGTYTLTRQGANEDAGLTGDLDIANSGSLKIVGASSATTTIDASGLFDSGLGYGDRIFDVQSGAVVDVEHLRITGGNSTEVGGIRGANATIRIYASEILNNKADGGGGGIGLLGGLLSLVDSTVSNNSAGIGGGIIVADALVSIVGTTFSGNSARIDGGAIYSSPDITISHSTFSQNTAAQGGALNIFLGKATIVDSSFSENSASSGGAIFANRASVFLSNTSVSDNSASMGGGILINHEDLVVSGSTLSGNDGGAVYSFSDNNVTVQNSVVSDNHSSHEGGGIRAFAIQITNSTIANNSANIGGGLSAQSLSAIGCTVAGNSAADYAGGIQATHAVIVDCTVSGNSITGSLTAPHPVNDGGGIYGKGFITNSTISGNSALNNGGGVSGNWTIRNSTITGNRADSDGNGGGGGGGYGTPSLPGAATLTLFNTIVAGNVRGAPDAETNDDIRIAGGTMAPSSAFNLIGDPNTAGGLVHGASGNIVGDGSGNLLDIHSVLDTTLGDNGGPTLTHALVPGSPAFNAGDPLFDPNATNPPTPFDQRGAGYGRVFGGRVDIGAVEFGTTFQAVVTGRQIFYDDSAFDNHTPGANPLDVLAIATDKQPLLPDGGLASAANVTSYANGINGIMIDIAGSHPDITAADFMFRVGNSNSPDSWGLAPAPASVTVLAGRGDAGTDRVVITWPSGAIVNAWLEVQVLATANTGLATSDVFYWGSKVGDSFTNPGAGTFNTTTADASQVFANLGSGKPITDLRDYNRDGVIDTADASIVFGSLGSIVRLSIPAAASPAVKTPEVRADGSVSAVASALAARVADTPAAPSPSRHVALPRATQLLPPRDQFFADLILEKAITANDRDRDDREDGSFAAGAAEEHADELALVLLGDQW